MNKQIYIALLAFALFFFVGCSNKSKKIDNMTTFAKVYGYVKYFHPSDEASQIDWNKFAIYGASQIDKCRTDDDIIKVLEELFKPIAPTIRFATDSLEFDINETIPDSIENLKITYWQHSGVSFGMDYNGNTYKSRRVNRDSSENSVQLFKYQPKTNECIIKEVGKGIYCRVPITLYCNKNYTFPKVNSNKLLELKNQLWDVNTSSALDLNLRLGNVINLYNVFQHFYPYFNEVDVNWDLELKNALNQSYYDETLLDHLTTLEKFTASIKDGHINIFNNSINNFYGPPISWEWVENKLIITKVEETNDSIKVGDVVTSINGKSSEQYFKETYSGISAATQGWLNYRANICSLKGYKKSSLRIKIKEKEYKLKRTVDVYDWSKSKRNKLKYSELEKGVWYLNLDIIEMDTINKLLPKLQESKAIICDMRGYPNGNHGFIQHLLATDDTTKAWIRVPQITYPDHNRNIGYENCNWVEFMKAKKPYLGDKNVIFIIDGRAISYAESYMGFIEGYKLATIIGQPTAGTNGNVNSFSLPGGFKVLWTGMKVVKHDGSQHHGIGILPDIYLEKTIQGVVEGRDEYLEKAIELTRI